MHVPYFIIGIIIALVALAIFLFVLGGVQGGADAIIKFLGG